MGRAKKTSVKEFLKDLIFEFFSDGMTLMIILDIIQIILIEKLNSNS